MTSAVERLTKLIDATDRHDIPLADLLPSQIEAANELLSNRLGRIKLLANRAETTGVRAIREPADLVPLLFAHTSYKSYPESWLVQGKWDRLVQWLDTVSALRVQGVDTKNVKDVDDFLVRLAATGHYVACSSGTTGKVSMINYATADRVINKRIAVASMSWAAGISPNRDRKAFFCNPNSNNFRLIDNYDALADSFGTDSGTRFPAGMMNVGQLREMVVLRKGIADGTARPADLANYDAAVASRQKAIDDAVAGMAEALVASRSQKLLITGMYALLFQIVEAIRGMGYSGEDFNPENVLMLAGGLKGAALPSDYHERIVGMFNVQPRHLYQMYGMIELNTFFPRCGAGRYHTPPWIMLLPLDRTGEQLLGPTKGEMEGRAGFFDLTIEGRWGGLISGDCIKVDYGKCACGHEGPTVGPEIVRYADLPGGDKISCAGTIDAYVRGVA